MELGASKNKNLLGEDRSEATPTLSHGTGGASHFQCGHNQVRCITAESICEAANY